MGFSSQELRGSGMEASSLECDKNEDGTLHCYVYGDDRQGTADGVEEVRTLDGVTQRERHFGPQENPHLEINFEWDGAQCHINGGLLECK